MMPENLQVAYSAIRAEIVANHVMMHWFTVITALVILLGVWLVESRTTVLSVLLPLLGLSWGVGMLRFDFFIHRQGAFLREIEQYALRAGDQSPMWELWKADMPATKYVVPAADAIGVLVIVVPTIYLLFGPAQEYFDSRTWRGGSAYAWVVSLLLLGALGVLPLVPRLAALR